MSQSGLGVLIHQLRGGTERVASDFYGRTIKDVEVTDDRVKLQFEDGTYITLTDQGQTCCESRYIKCDDDPQTLVGDVLKNIEVKSHEEHEGEYGDTHEILFVEIATDQDHITVNTHNEHNGYYGGFALNITEGRSD